MHIIHTISSEVASIELIDFTCNHKNRMSIKIMLFQLPNNSIDSHTK